MLVVHLVDRKRMLGFPGDWGEVVHDGRVNRMLLQRVHVRPVIDARKTAHQAGVPQLAQPLLVTGDI